MFFNYIKSAFIRKNIFLYVFFFTIIFSQNSSDKALKFDQGQYARIPISESLSNFNQFTLECWYYETGFSGGDERIVGTETANSNSGIYLNRYSNSWSYGLGDESGTFLGNGNIGSVSQNEWIHVAITYDGITIRLFANGQLVHSQDGTLSNIGNPNSDLVINRHTWNGGSSSRLSGYLDELRISSIARYTSNFDVPQNEFNVDEYTAGLWHFNGNISDVSGNENHAILSGSSIVDFTPGLDVPEIDNEEELVSGLFFSEYAEGSFNNKYIEIYNGSGLDIDLGNYSLSKCNNGCDIENQFDYPDELVFQMGTTIASGDVYVICHGSASDEILAECDTTYTYLSNGDDFFALTRVGVNENNYTIVDKIGDFGDDPGSGWDVAGVIEATKDHTLIRRNWVNQGNNDWSESAGTNAEDSEWIVEERPTADYTPSTIGLHLEQYNEENYSIHFDFMSGYSESLTSSTNIFGGIQPFTVEAWYKNEGVNTGANLGYDDGANIVSSYRRSGGGDPYGNFNFGIHSGDSENTGKGYADHGVKTNERIDDGEWHHLAATYEPNSDGSWSFRLYLDGVLNDQNTGPSEGYDHTSSNNKIRMNNHSPFAGDHMLDCSYAGMSITNGLKYTENFSPQFPLNPNENTIVNLDFSEGDGSQLIDNSGNGNHFNLYGNYQWGADVPSQPVYGCTDSYATNYNAEATVDDGMRRLPRKWRILSKL